MSKVKKLAEKFLRKLEFEPAPLSTNKGRHIETKSPITKKDRRHSGHKVYFSDDDDYPIQFDTYDEWSNYRDSLRDVYTDSTRIKKVNRKGGWRFEQTMQIQENNKKIKKIENIKERRRASPKRVVKC